MKATIFFFVLTHFFLQANAAGSTRMDPNAICMDITVSLANNGVFFLIPEDIDNGSEVPSGFTTEISVNFVDCSNIGNPLSVRLSILEGTTEVSSCTAIVTVVDNAPPLASCQDLTVAVGNNSQISFTPNDIDSGSTDNCGIASSSLSISQFDCTNIGMNTVSLIVNDVNGNTGTCQANVTVEDNLPPNTLCQSTTVFLGSNGVASLNYQQVDGGSNDNCAIASWNVSPSSFDCSSVGINSVVLTVMDVNGNSNTCSAQVNVQDNIAPDLSCEASLDIFLDENGQATVTSSDIILTASDNCSLIPTMGQNPTYDCSSVGINTYTIMVDDVNGNSNSCTANINVVDNIAPTSLCNDITVSMNSNGSAMITPNHINAGSADNCAITSIMISDSQFDCSNVGVNPVSLVITDNNNNSSSCQSNVTLQDNMAPITLCQNIVVSLEANEVVSIVADDIDGGTNDNCAIQSLSIENNSYSCVDEGIYSLQLSALDVNGNMGTCLATVEIVCETLPVEFGAFEIQELESVAHISWETFVEIDNDYFIIERSIDNEIYESIGKIEGSGNSTSTKRYEFFDSSLENAIIYYRIKQVDLDGSFSYSQTKSLDNRSQEKLTFWPNPSSDRIIIESAGSEEPYYQIISTTNEVLKAGKGLSISVRDLSSGIYFIKINFDGRWLVEPIIVGH